MTRAVRKKSATYDDVLRAPDHLIAEILEGELFTSPRPAWRHAVAHTNLIPILHGPFYRGLGGPGGWWILLEPELHLNEPTDVIVPDLAGWRVERMPTPPDDHRFRVVPDWVCEVLSPSTERLDRTRKLRIYARAGVKHVWLLNAVERTLETYRLERAAWTLAGVHADQETARIEPFGAIEIGLKDLWREPAPASPVP